MRRSRKGYTIIELIVAILVIGILAAIAIAKFVSVKEKAFVASMKADLRNFAIYEQEYEIDGHGTFFAGNGAAQGFRPTPGVTVTATVDPGPPPVWQAVAHHDKTTRVCQIVTTNASVWDIDCP